MHSPSPVCLSDEGAIKTFPDPDALPGMEVVTCLVSLYILQKNALCIK